jgi:hypothetical protein
MVAGYLPRVQQERRCNMFKSIDNWKRFLGNGDDVHDNDVLELLHHTETAFVRMLHGIILFFWERIPNLFRVLLRWLQRFVSLAIRITIRLIRVGVVATAWLAVVFGPAYLQMGFISCLWTLLAIAGSVFGLRRRTLKARAAVAKTATPPTLLTVVASPIGQH